MANTPSAKKDIIKNRARRLRNRSERNRLKNCLKSIKPECMAAKSIDEILHLKKITQSCIDKSVIKGIIHFNKGERHKRQLFREIDWAILNVETKKAETILDEATLARAGAVMYDVPEKGRSSIFEEFDLDEFPTRQELERLSGIFKEMPRILIGVEVSQTSENTLRFNAKIPSADQRLSDSWKLEDQEGAGLTLSIQEFEWSCLTNLALAGLPHQTQKEHRTLLFKIPNFKPGSSISISGDITLTDPGIITEETDSVYLSKITVYNSMGSTKGATDIYLKIGRTAKENAK